jgi:hypothetical protein
MSTGRNVFKFRQTQAAVRTFAPLRKLKCRTQAKQSLAFAFNRKAKDE